MVEVEVPALYTAGLTYPTGVGLLLVLLVLCWVCSLLLWVVCCLYCCIVALTWCVCRAAPTVLTSTHSGLFESVRSSYRSGYC